MFQSFIEKLSYQWEGNFFKILLISIIFLLVAYWVEKHRPRLMAFFSSNILVKKNIPDIFYKGLVVSVFIVLSKILIYYLPVKGVVQTKFSIWWLEPLLLFVFYLTMVFELIIISGLIKKKSETKSNSSGKKKDNDTLVGCSILIIGSIIIFFFIAFATKLNATMGEFFLLFLLIPLLFVKMICSGKFFGLLTGLLLGVFIIFRYYHIDATPKREKSKYFKKTLYVLLILSISIFFIITGDLETQFTNRLNNLKNEEQLSEILQAAVTIPYMNNEILREQIFKKIVDRVEEIDFPLNQNTYHLLLKGARSIRTNYNKANLMKDIAVLIGKKGDISLALSTAGTIKAPLIQLDTILSILKTIPELEKSKWTSKILNAAVKSVHLVVPWDYKAKSFKNIALMAISVGKKEFAEEMFNRALESANMIKTNTIWYGAINPLIISVAESKDTVFAIKFLKEVTQSIDNTKSLYKIKIMIKTGYHLSRLGETDEAKKLFQNILNLIYSMDINNVDDLLGELALSVSYSDLFFANSIARRIINTKKRTNIKKQIGEIQKRINSN